MMRDDHDSVDGIRRLAAYDRERLVSSWSDSEAKKALLQEITDMPRLATESPPSETSRPQVRLPRKRLVAFAAIGLMMLSGVAVAAGIFSPDPHDVSTILADAKEAGTERVKTEGWRPTLATEEVWCAYTDGVPVVSEDGADLSTGPEVPLPARTFQFALDEPMSEADLVAACAEARRGHEPPEEFTVCEGYAPAEGARDALAHPGRFQRVDGEVTTSRPGFPVVVGWVADCDQVTFETNSPPVNVRAGLGIDAINRAREVEIGLTAAAFDRCLTLDETRELARQAQPQLDGDWLIAERPRGQDPCHRVWMNPQLGLLEIGPSR